MNDITFGLLLSIVVLGIALPIAGRLWPEQSDNRPASLELARDFSRRAGRRAGRP